PMYELEKTAYTLADAKTVKSKDGENLKVLSVPLVFKTADGIEIIKTFNFTEGEYPVVVNHKVVNRSGQTWQGQMFGQIKRDNSEDPGKSDQGIFTLGTFLGGAWGTPDEQYNKLKFDNFVEEKVSTEATGGWVA
ncbi:membrane protein insertase YidC, partial [Klebsiella pneumoniae]|nr:membrane protein insertase YidC [Klebsiella pneumoniae]